MTRLAGFAAAVSLLGLVGHAYAQPQLISPPLWTDSFTASACYVRNIGTTPFVVKVKLFGNNDTGNGNIDTCSTGPLQAGKTCSVFSSQISADSWEVCSVQASNANVSKLRGRIDIRRAVGSATVVVSEDLQ